MCPLLKSSSQKPSLQTLTRARRPARVFLPFKGQSPIRVDLNLVCLGFNLRDILARFFFGRSSLPARSSPQHIFHADIFRRRIASGKVRRSLSWSLAGSQFRLTRYTRGQFGGLFVV